jgi:transposase
MASEMIKTRRRYGAEFRAQVLAECDAPGASVAQVAMTHGINANVVHRWRQLAREAVCAKPAALPAAAPSGFVPVVLGTALASPSTPTAALRLKTDSPMPF